MKRDREPAEWRACRQRTPEEKEAVYEATVKRSMRGWAVEGFALSGRDRARNDKPANAR